MLPLSANSDFKNIETFLVDDPYYDLNGGMSEKDAAVEIYGTNALDQSIELLLATEPGERMFNLEFWSPIYKLLFENSETVEYKKDEVFDCIEKWIPISVDRNSAELIKKNGEHSMSLKIPYYFDWNGQRRYHIFSRVIGL